MPLVQIIHWSCSHLLTSPISFTILQSSGISHTVIQLKQKHPLGASATLIKPKLAPMSMCRILWHCMFMVPHVAYLGLWLCMGVIWGVVIESSGHLIRKMSALINSAWFQLSNHIFRSQNCWAVILQIPTPFPTIIILHLNVNGL